MPANPQDRIVLHSVLLLLATWLAAQAVPSLILDLLKFCAELYAYSEPAVRSVLTMALSLTALFAGVGIYVLNATSGMLRYTVGVPLLGVAGLCALAACAALAAWESFPRVATPVRSAIDQRPATPDQQVASPPPNARPARDKSSKKGKPHARGRDHDPADEPYLTPLGRYGPVVVNCDAREHGPKRDSVLVLRKSQRSASWGGPAICTYQCPDGSEKTVSVSEGRECPSTTER